MAFKKKIIIKRPEPDCIDFKPFPLDKKHCRLTEKCANARIKYKMVSIAGQQYQIFCTGISRKKFDKWVNDK